MSNFSTKDLFFQDNNIKIISSKQETVDEHTTITMLIESVNPKAPDECPRCGCIGDFERKDYYIRKLIDQKIRDESVIVNFRQLRFRCKACKCSVNEVVDFVEKSARITNRLKENIINEIKREHTFLDVAISNEVSQTTVQNIFENKIDVKRLPLSEVLCFDEFRGPAEIGKYPFIIVNPYTSEIIDIVLSREQNYLFHYFKKIPLAEREKVKYIVTDLTGNYVGVIRSCFPNAKHIADRFHWIKLIIQAVQDIRIQAMKFHLNCAKKDTKENCLNPNHYLSAMRNTEHYKIYHTLKKYYKLLNYNVYDNDYPALLEGKGKLYNEKDSITKQEILEFIVNNDRELEEAYSLLQELNIIAYSATYDTATKEITDWIKKVEKSDRHIEPLKEAVKTIKIWRTPIVNSFIIDEEKIGLLSNGCCEAKNNTVKTIVKIGQGYKKPTLLRSVVLAADRERTKRKNEQREKKYNNFIKKNSK